MTPEERNSFKNEIKELLQLYLTNLNGQTQSKFDIIDVKLDSIQQQVTKANGRTGKLEETVSEILKQNALDKQNNINQHENLVNEIKNQINTCPINKRVETLEVKSLTKEEVKKKMIQTITITSMVSGIIFGILKLIFG
jgi:hypothetical protein